MNITLFIGTLMGISLLLLGFFTENMIYLTSGGFMIISNQISILIYSIRKQYDQ